MNSVNDILNAIAPPDRAAMAQAQTRLDALVKPPGSLGRLEALAVQLAGIRGSGRPLQFPQKEIVVMAADHGVWQEGITPSPQVVTAIQAGNILRGVAGVNAMAKIAGAAVTLVDTGIIGGPVPGAVACHQGEGSGNIARGPAMTREQAEQLLLWGANWVAERVAQGLTVLGVGELGMGNTTPAAAVIAAITGQPPEQVAGLGANLPPTQLGHKVAVIEQALAINRPQANDGLEVLAKVGGFDLVAMSGAMLGAAAAGIPVVLDGFLSYASALAACQIAPAVWAYLIPSHTSAERGSQIALTHLRLQPYLDLSLRLGEGSGAALAFNLIDAACAMHNEMATLAECNIAL
ncbi:nicotinate-nucleotide--dimethylbenzimidazole phosphoribosyltransferase [Nissabacter sp. SGAir0207]|uniref:nicotinate-nucleotide--dimethylbenzimidazole phosphoribosyltransferase n=1 Tax=Nissabacter sp. SGAir0207 TaxID=2126321 RepID=UPI0010CD5607|nr:nicotinate-nucleotide--dimethylbenzimidazole phosphoribosyltransferase [Nissabacter sp. SGAir0207]QCR36203.1 nicotinate-nucleotide--dimethylbenzimidazole phosphoribosyltransferase [Nissabacter sp. SGAir0207]